jgi:hypothetical protein
MGIDMGVDQKVCLQVRRKNIMENNQLKILLRDNRRKGNIDIDRNHFSLLQRILQSKKGIAEKEALFK